MSLLLLLNHAPNVITPTPSGGMTYIAPRRPPDAERLRRLRILRSDDDLLLL